MFLSFLVVFVLFLFPIISVLVVLIHQLKPSYNEKCSLNKVFYDLFIFIYLFSSYPHFYGFSFGFSLTEAFLRRGKKTFSSLQYFYTTTKSNLYYSIRLQMEILQRYKHD